MCNYATKSDLKIATGVTTSSFAKNSDLAILKSDVYELDIDKLNVPIGLSNWKKKVGNKLDVDKLLPIPSDL